MRVGTAWWSLEPRAGWSAADDPECLTLTRSDQGAFQLSAARRPEGAAELAELRHAAERERDLMGSPFPVVVGGFHGFSVSYSRDGVFWRRWWLARGRLWIFATYNGAPSARVLEEPEVEGMLATLRAEDGVA
jgi:hypothetical protein